MQIGRVMDEAEDQARHDDDQTGNYADAEQVADQQLDLSHEVGDGPALGRWGPELFICRVLPSRASEPRSKAKRE